MKQKRKNFLEKNYHLLMLGLSVVIIGYSLYGLYVGNVMFCGRGGACSIVNINENRGKFLSIIVFYIFVGLFFLYLFIRHIKNKQW